MSTLSEAILTIESPVSEKGITGQLIQGDFFQLARFLPSNFISLLILDPPYNLTKNYNGEYFGKMTEENYSTWFARAIALLDPMLKSDATVYVCADWRTSRIVLPILEDQFHVQNRITWEREKGRGAKRNWKNNTEDIWFCTKSSDYYFNVDSVKLKRKVLAPYRDNGIPKDWIEETDGNFRMTYPSNIWTDLTVPFWSMPENTPHPTQKPEKLLAKLILASSREGDFVFDPFVGSGTTAVVAEKLGRRWCGMDINLEFLCWARKRVLSATQDATIQGYSEGVFWERNTLARSKHPDLPKRDYNRAQGDLFE